MLGPRRREDLQVHPGFREKLGILPGLVPPHYASQRPADIPADQELRVKDLPDAPAMPDHLHGHRVDQEGPVVGNDLNHRGAPAVQPSCD